MRTAIFFGLGVAFLGSIVAWFLDLGLWFVIESTAYALLGWSLAEGARYLKRRFFS